MANLASSAVTINRSWTEGGVTGKELSCRDVTAVLTGQGGTTNLITAASLSLVSIQQVSIAVANDNSKVYSAAPSFDNLKVLLVDLTQVTDASRIPADITATVRFTVKGFL